MNPLQSDQLFGNWASVMLPIRDDDTIDFGALDQQIAYLAQCGLNGVYTNGTSGEFYAQSEEEFDRIHSMLKGHCERLGTPFQIGASHGSPQGMLRRIRRARELEPSAIQVVLPDWFPLTDDELHEFFEGVFDAAGDVSVVLYNPAHAKRRLDPRMFGRLEKEFPNLIGIGVPHGAPRWYEQLQQHVKRMSVFIPGHNLVTGCTQGARGSFSNVACLHPKLAQRLYDLLCEDPDRADALENRIQGFLTNHVVPYQTEDGHSNAALDKLLAAVGGWCEITPRLRWPYRSVPGDVVPRLRGVVFDMLPELEAWSLKGARATRASPDRVVAGR